MGPVRAFDVIIAAWMVIACALLVFMIRRGHNPTRWVILSFLLGPFAVVWALWARSRSSQVGPSIRQWGERGPGQLSVLVGVDGSSASHGALAGAIDVFGPRLGMLTLASGIDFESAAAKEASPAQSSVDAILEREAAMVQDLVGFRPRTMVLAGAPGEALVAQARRDGVDWLVIGTDGTGSADWLQGSVAAELAAGRSGIPVMIISQAQPQ